VFTIIEQCKKDGIAIIVVSSELKEIIAISDEILVLRDGRVTGFLRGPEISEEALMKCAISAKTKARAATEHTTEVTV
jgi:ABC-type sugar transport system ATPase subunit